MARTSKSTSTTSGHNPLRLGAALGAGGVGGSADKQAGAARRIVIDARESGTSTGRYVDKLIEHLHKLQPNQQIVILTKSRRLAFMKSMAPNFKVVKSNFKEFSLAEQLGLPFQLYKLKPDLVHFSMTHQPVLYFGKVVTTVHDLTTARWRNPSKNWLIFKIKQLVYRLVIKWVARKSAAIITISKFTERDLVSFAPSARGKTHVIYEAADPIKAIPEPVKELEGQPFLLYVGRPLPHKNLESLLDILPTLQQQRPDLKLALVGQTDDNYRRLERQVKKRGIDGVIFSGFVPDGQLRWLYEHATVYVFPSLAEGFGLPPLEAMQYDLPVAASSASCLPEILQNAAIYFDPQNADDAAHQISRLLDDPKLAKDQVAKGRKLLEQYSWDKTARQTFNLYQRLLD